MSLEEGSIIEADPVLIQRGDYCNNLVIVLS